MLTITVPATDFFDDNTQTFVSTKETTLLLEHSLLSLSKWESRWKKPFLKEQDNKSSDEILDYIRCMTITQNVSDEIYLAIAASKELCNKIVEYINDPMTATTFTEVNDTNKKRNNQIVTSELIYYWMIQLNIPVEFQKWHLSRLLTLIRICEIKNTAANKKMPKSAIRNRNRALNAQRKAKLGTTG